MKNLAVSLYLCKFNNLKRIALKVLLIDFYDSFTFNIYHYLQGMAVDVDVVEDDQLDIDTVGTYDAIIFSPGPGLPSEKKSLKPVLDRYAGKKKILGICLGMQGIAEYYGAELYNQQEVKHGVSEKINLLEQDGLFSFLPSKIDVGLYHSWAVKLKDESPFIPMAFSVSGVLMAIRHHALPVYGVQFHPESILTPLGKQIIRNFVFRV